MVEKIAPYFIAFILLCIVAEAGYSKRNKKHLYEKQDTRTSILFGIIGVITRIFLKGLNLIVWVFLFEISPFKIERTALSLVVLFLLNEFIYYWFHRLSHEIPFFWATHVNHHSSNKMNFAVATRTPFLNAIYHILFWIPLPLMGFHPIDVLLVETLSFFVAFIQHTTVIPKLGVFEWVFNTPSHHRVHHASNPKYLDKNYGNVLIIYDRVFGTFQQEDEMPIYGIIRNPIDRRFFNMVFHGWKDWANRNRKIDKI